MAEGGNPLVKAYKVLRWFFLAGAAIMLFLALKSPSDPGPQLDRATQREQAQSFEEKITSLESAHHQGSTAEVGLESAEINAALAQSIPSPVVQAQFNQNPAATDNTGKKSAKSSSDGQIKDARVEFSSDVVTGYFTTQAYGQDVHLTVAGRLGCKDGYATFEPTSFKVGDLSVPVSFVNPTLQKKLAEPETHDKLKLPDFVADLRVQDGKLIVVER